jgi:hypothetical protein
MLLLNGAKKGEEYSKSVIDTFYAQQSMMLAGIFPLTHSFSERLLAFLLAGEEKKRRKMNQFNRFFSHDLHSSGRRKMEIFSQKLSNRFSSCVFCNNDEK